MALRQVIREEHEELGLGRATPFDLAKGFPWMGLPKASLFGKLRDHGRIRREPVGKVEGSGADLEKSGGAIRRERSGHAPA
jgi:hypothetical protein